MTAHTPGPWDFTKPTCKECPTAPSNQRGLSPDHRNPMRYVVEWAGWPNGSWVVRDLTTGAAYRKPGKAHFWHGEFPQACKLADRLNK